MATFNAFNAFSALGALMLLVGRQGARCRLAYGPADATATRRLLLQ